MMDGEMTDERDSAPGAWRKRIEAAVEEPDNRCRSGRKR